MKKYQARKALSVLLALLMVLTSVYAGLGVFAYAAAPEEVKDASPTLASGKVYTVTQDTTIAGTSSANGLTVPANTIVIIDIAAGKTLTVKGGDADGATAGKAGIKMNNGSKLIITGSGTLVVIGGKGGNGGTGNVNYGNNDSTGGNGGNGGAGGGAGIGTNGAEGGAANGGKGGTPDAWPTGNNAATVTIAPTVSFDGGTNGDNGSKGGTVNSTGASRAGGTGGGGGSGAGGFAFGAGGIGGGAGGKGGNGGRSSACGGDYQGKGGGGGTGATTAGNGDPGNGRTGDNNNTGAGGAGGGKGTAKTAYTPIRSNPFNDMATAINTYKDYYTMSMEDMLGLENMVSTLGTVKSDLNDPYSSLIESYGADVYDYYFNNPDDGDTTNDYDTEELFTTINNALNMQPNIELAQRLMTQAAVTISDDMNSTALGELYNPFRSDYDTYEALPQATKTYLESKNYINTTTVESKLQELLDAYDTAVLREQYETVIKANVATYSAYDNSWVATTENAGSYLSAAKSTVEGYITLLNGKSATAVKNVFGENYIAGTLQPLISSFAALMEANELKEEFTSYKTVYNQAFAPVTDSFTDEQLYNVLNARDSWYTSLQDYVSELREFDETFANQVLGDLYNAMETKIQQVYAMLGARVTSHVQTAYDQYQSFVAIYGTRINALDDVTIANYNALNATFGELKTAHYNFAKDSDRIELTQETIDQYEFLKFAIEAFEFFEPSRGLSAFELNKEPVEEIVRHPMANDLAREIDYVASDEKLETVISKLDALLTSERGQQLLGLDKSIGALISDMLKEKLYSDDFLNALIYKIYPLIVENLALLLDDKAGGYASLLYDLGTIGKNIGLEAVPEYFANNITSFQTVKSKLAAVTTDVKVNDDGTVTDPWNDSRLLSNGKLNLPWGITDRESFLTAASQAFKGLDDLLFALATGKTWSTHGNAAKLGTIAAVLYVNATGNLGYNNAIAPIFEALGVSAPSLGSSTTVRQLFEKGFVEPIEALTAKLKTEPVATILSILPNLAYAVKAGLVTPLLSQLKTALKISAKAEGLLINTTVIEEQTVDFDLSTLINFEDLGIKVDSLNNLLDSLVALLTKDESTPVGEIPKIFPATDDVRLAHLGELTWKNTVRSAWNYTYGPEGKAAYIEANKADVLIVLVKYLLRVINDEEAFAQIKELFAKLIPAEESPDNPTPTEPEEPSELLQTILSNVVANPELAIAALTELTQPQTYAFKQYKELPTSDLSYNDATDIAYLKYQNSWTQEKAMAVLDGVDGIVESFLNGQTLEAFLHEKIDDIFAPATITSIATALVDIGDKLGGNKTIAGLLQSELGINLSAWKTAFSAVFAENAAVDTEGTLNGLTAKKTATGIEWTVDGVKLEEGNVGGFFDAVSELLVELAPVLKIVFTGENIGILNSTVIIQGYDSYNNAITVLFDALGIEQIAEETYATYTPKQAFEAVVGKIGDKLDELLSGDLIVNVLNLVPHLIAFLDKEGVSTALYNLLLPIYVVLDTIRPIYEVNLMDLLGGLIGGDDASGSEEEPFLTLDDVLNGLTSKDLIEKVDERFGTKLDGTPITGYMIPALYAIDKDMATKYDGDADREKKIAADVLTVILSGALEGLMAKSGDGDTDNAVVLLNALDKPEYATYYNLAVKLLTGEEFSGDYMKINWGYMIGEEGTDWQLSTLVLPEDNQNLTKSYVQYANDWNKNVAEYVDDNLDDIVAEILAALEKDDLSTILKGLIEGNVYTNDVRDAIANALKTVVEKLNGFLGIADVMLETDLQHLDFDHLPNVTNKTTFIEALDTMLSKLNGVLAFALFGEDYKFFYKSSNGTDMLVLGGGEVYNVALIPLLELLGCKPKAASEYLADGKYDAAAAMHDVLVALTDRIDVITEDPINELLNMLPNLLYFINADGVKAVVSNALAPFENVIRTVLPLVSPDNAPAEGEPLFEIVEGVSIDDLTTDNLLMILEDKTDLTLTNKQKEILKGFYLGTLTGYDSANGKRAFRMEYEVKPTGEGDETTLDRKDMITLLLGFVIDVLSTEANRDAAEELLGENIAPIIFNILGMKKAVREKIEWMGVPDKVGEVFTAMDTTKEFSRNYGPLFTKDMAEYIAANLDTFLDNMVQLLGIPASTFDGLNLDIKSDSGFITSVEDLVNGLLEGTLYKAELVETIRGYILQAVDMINGLPASNHIKEVLKLAIGLDVDYYNKYYENGVLQPIPEFDNSDPVNNPLRDQFVNALCDVLKPLYPLLQWLLSDRDISILYNSEGSDLITLFGFEGYRYGIAPIFEALGVDRPTQEEINGKDTTEKLLKAIINPLLDRLDEIIADPVNELFAILPEVAYFINTKGLDVSYKNLLAAVKTVLDAVDPLLPEDAKGKIAPIIAGQFGNLNITELTMQTLLDMVASNLGDGMDTLAFDAVAETTFGQLVSYDSELDYDAYKMQYVDEDSEADALTALLRLALRWIATGENGAKLKALVRENIEMSAEGYDYIDKLIDIVVAYAGTNSGMDSLLHMLYYIFYGIHNGTAAVAGWQRDYNSRFEAIDGVVQELTPRDENLGKVAELLDWLFVTYGDGDKDDTGNVYHNYDDDEMGSPAAGKPKGFAPNGFIAFFRQIIEWFKTIFNKIFKH